MAALIGMSNAAWKRQPSGRVSLDWKSPLTKNLRGFYTFSESGVQLINRVDQVLTNSYTGSPNRSAKSPTGQGHHTNSTSGGQYLLNNNWSSMVDRFDGCLALAGYPMSPYVGSYLFAMIGPSDNRYYLRRNTTNALYGWNTSATALTGPSWVAFQYGTTAMEWGGNNSDGKWSAFFAGRRLNTTASQQSEGPENSSLATLNAGSPGTGTFHANFIYHWLGLWSRAIGDAAHYELHVNPWQILIAAPSRFYLIPTDVAAALPTLSAATAINITSGGFQPRVTATY